MQEKAASSAGMRRARGAASALLARRHRAARQPRGGPIGYSGRSCRWCPPGRRLCAHSATVAHRSWCLTPGRSALPTKIRTPVTGVFRSSGADASMLPRIPSSEGPTGACQATASRAWTTLPADATGGLAEEAPGHTAPKLRGAHARNSAQGVLMRRQTWRTPDVAATLRPMVRNAPRGGPPLPAWRRGTKFFKQNYPDHE